MTITTISLSSLNGTNGFRLDGASAYDFSGFSVSSAGDVNGDGFNDLIIGASGADPNGYSSGSSYVVFGKGSDFDATLNLSSLDGTNGFRLDGVAERDSSGNSVSSAGDVNGDGFDDLIIGAFGADPNGYSSGSSYVMFGKTSGFDATLNLSSLDGTNGFRLDGTAAYNQLGESVSNAGDVNGDGFDDLIVGARFTDSSNSFGTSYVVFGKASGFTAKLDLSGLNGSDGFRMDGKPVYNASSHSVSNAGDVNGDGFDDLIIGALDPLAQVPEDEYSRSGDSYVVFGSASGFSATMDLSNLDSNKGFSLDGQINGDHFGNSVSSAGDINGDGLDDLIIGATYANSNGNLSGSSYVLFGRASGLDDTMNLSELDGNNGFRLDGVAERDSSGNSVSSAGDVNGDGFDDLIIGAFGADPNGYSSGSSYVMFGKASGFDATLNLSSLYGINGFRLDGVAEYDNSGSSVSGAGDVNGDGFDDLIVGAFGADPNGTASGSSYVIFGRSDFTGINMIKGTSGDDTLDGTQTADFFEASDGSDTMFGHGGADVFHGGAGDDDIKIFDLTFGLADGGAGDDVLYLVGSDLNLDLAGAGDKITGIETISLYGNGDNTLALTVQDVLSLSDTTNILRVHGNVGDRITGLNKGWADEGVGPNGYFHKFTQGDAVLLVGMNMTTDFA